VRERTLLGYRFIYLIQVVCATVPQIGHPHCAVRYPSIKIFIINMVPRIAADPSSEIFANPPVTMRTGDLAPSPTLASASVAHLHVLVRVASAALLLRQPSHEWPRALLIRPFEFSCTVCCEK
jgi:hypothetical protein